MRRLETEDDGLVMRPCGEWTAEKLDYLERYVGMFTAAMRGRPWRALNYIDLFSGPGKCRISGSGKVLPGSPLIALGTRYPFSHCYYGDIDPSNIRALQQRLSGLQGADSRTTCIVGDANRIVHDVVQSVLMDDQARSPGQWRSLNLAFLDPEAFELCWDTVVALSQIRCDLIIYYPQSALHRNLRQFVESDRNTVADTFFGGPEWREVVRKAWLAGPPSVAVHRQLMDLYKDKLSALGYGEVLRDDETGDQPLIRNAANNAPLYRLLFASKSPLGNSFWHKVTRRDLHGQRRLF